MYCDVIWSQEMHWFQFVSRIERSWKLLFPLVTEYLLSIVMLIVET